MNGPNGLVCGSDCSFTFAAGTSLDLTATPAAGQLFSGWQGACTGSAGCHLTMNEDEHLTSVFADECTKLLPNPNPGAPAHSYELNGTGFGIDPASATTDGNGTLVINGGGANDQPFQTVFLSNDGATTYNTISGGERGFIEELAGFDGTSGDVGNVQLMEWDTHGAPLKSMPISRFEQIVSDPTGGVVLFNTDTDAVTAYDASLNLRWTVQVPSLSEDPYGAFVDRLGNVLILDHPLVRTPPFVDAVWIRHDGKMQTERFQLAGPLAEQIAVASAQQRVGGGFFFRFEDGTEGQLDSLSTGPLSPLPAFLHARPAALYMIHGGTGYAAITQPVFGCQATVDVISASGKVCGTAVFSATSASCNFPTTSVGYDGTVIMSYGVGGTTSTTQWWPRFFQ